MAHVHWLVDIGQGCHAAVLETSKRELALSSAMVREFGRLRLLLEHPTVAQRTRGAIKRMLELVRRRRQRRAILVSGERPWS